MSMVFLLVIHVVFSFVNPMAPPASFPCPGIYCPYKPSGHHKRCKASEVQGTGPVNPPQQEPSKFAISEPHWHRPCQVEGPVFKAYTQVCRSSKACQSLLRHGAFFFFPQREAQDQPGLPGVSEMIIRALHLLLFDTSS